MTCIGWVGEFMGVESDDAVFMINSEFYDKALDPQLIMSMVTLLDRDIIAEKDIFDRLKSAGIVDPERRMEDVRDEAGMTSPIPLEAVNG
jgi:hypothetical protein